MRAIILAAGQGTRLKKYTENLPKGMLSFMGMTLIERQIKMYKAAGIERIIIVRGYAADKIGYDGVFYYTNADYASTNMVESLMCARYDFDDDIIVSYSDIVFERSLLDKMVGLNTDYAVAVDDDWKKYWQKRYGRVDHDTESLSIDREGNITELGLENAPVDTIDSRYIGLLRFSKKGMQDIARLMDDAYKLDPEAPWQRSGKPVRRAYMTDLLNALIQSGHKVRAERFRGGWLEFDTNEDYENACAWADDGSLKSLISI